MIIKFTKILISLMVALILGTVSSTLQAAELYKIDPVHSSIGFAVKHLMVSDVKGEFTGYEGTINFDPADVGATQIEITVQAKTIDTRNEKRDEHLRGAEFLGVAQYPLIIFKSRGLNKADNNYVISGDLTIHGVTKTISIPVQITGPIKSPFGNDVIGIIGETVINRQDYGVSWNKVMDNGGYVVGDEVKILISIEADK